MMRICANDADGDDDDMCDADDDVVMRICAHDADGDVDDEDMCE